MFTQIVEFSLNGDDLSLKFFFKIHKISIIGIFLLPKYVNRLEIVISDFTFNSVYP